MRPPKWLQNLKAEILDRLHNTTTSELIDIMALLGFTYFWYQQPLDQITKFLESTKAGFDPFGAMMNFAQLIGGQTYGVIATFWNFVFGSKIFPIDKSEDEGDKHIDIDFEKLLYSFILAYITVKALPSALESISGVLGKVVKA
jgi:hypothetical protein